MVLHVCHCFITYYHHLCIVTHIAHINCRLFNNPCRGTASSLCAGDSQNDPDGICQASNRHALEAMITYIGPNGRANSLPDWEFIDNNVPHYGVRLSFIPGDVCWDHHSYAHQPYPSYVMVPLAISDPWMINSYLIYLMMNHYVHITLIIDMVQVAMDTSIVPLWAYHYRV